MVGAKRSLNPNNPLTEDQAVKILQEAVALARTGRVDDAKRKAGFVGTRFYMAPTGTMMQLQNELQSVYGQQRAKPSYTAEESARAFYEASDREANRAFQPSMRSSAPIEPVHIGKMFGDIVKSKYIGVIIVSAIGVVLMTTLGSLGGPWLGIAFICYAFRMLMPDEREIMEKEEVKALENIYKIEQRLNQKFGRSQLNEIRDQIEEEQSKK